MGVKFFGTFLVEEGVINGFQLRQATEHMTWLHRTLGELAIRLEYMSAADVKKVLQAQRDSDELFGEIAVRLGLLSRRQLEEMVEKQAASVARLGESLVELDHLAEEQVKELLQRFEATQTPYAAENRVIPEELGDSALADRMLDDLPRFCLRTALLPVKVGDALPWSGETELPHRFGVEARGVEDLRVGLACDDAFARALACGQLGLRDEQLEEETLVDAAAELPADLLRRANRGLVISRPQQGALPGGGHAFEFVATSGGGLLIIEKV